MQRTTPEGIIISCDYCGVDWDQELPMIEGHHGSVLCLSCLAMSLDQLAVADAPINCSLCLQEQPEGTEHWVHPKPDPSDGLNPHGVLCRSCARQAARAYHKDPDIDFKWDELLRTEAIRAGKSK